MDFLDYELVRNIAGDEFAQQFFTWTAALGVASFIHSGRVKKEVRAVVDALNNVALALKQDLKSHSERIEKVEKGLEKLIDRVDVMEFPEA